MLLAPPPKKLITGRLLVRNTALNIIGQGLPMIVAFFTIPILIKALGTDRFGVLTIAWMTIGYFSLFDFGIGRALTQILSEMLATENNEKVSPLIWTSGFLLVMLGIFGSIVLCILTPTIVSKILKIPFALHQETMSSFYVLAIAVPFVISTAGLAGILAAYQKFGTINALRVPLGLLNYIAPILILPFSRSLFPIVLVLMFGRVISWLAHLAACFKVIPKLSKGIRIDATIIKPIIHFGSWMTVSNIISPIMVVMDRFIIGALLSITYVAYYATPYEMVTRLWLVPTALVGVLFPAFASTYVQDKIRANMMYARSLKYVYLALYPITMFIILFAHEGLTLWLGNEFASNSTDVLKLLAVGVFINSLAQVSFALVQGVGRPDITSKLHLVELALYLPLLLWLITNFGITGAAIAWVIRISIDTFALFYVSIKLLQTKLAAIKEFIPIIAEMVLLLLAYFISGSTLVKSIYFVVTFIFYLYSTYSNLLDDSERKEIIKLSKLQFN